VPVIVLALSPPYLNLGLEAVQPRGTLLLWEIIEYIFVGKYI